MRDHVASPLHGPRPDGERDPPRPGRPLETEDRWGRWIWPRCEDMRLANRIAPVRARSIRGRGVPGGGGMSVDVVDLFEIDAGRFPQAVLGFAVSLEPSDTGGSDIGVMETESPSTRMRSGAPVSRQARSTRWNCVAVSPKVTNASRSTLRPGPTYIRTRLCRRSGRRGRGQGLCAIGGLRSTPLRNPRCG